MVRVVAVIGALSRDSILTLGQVPEHGGMNRAQKHRELGGRGLNIAIAAYRSVHPRPAKGVVQQSDRDDIEVRMIGAVANEAQKKEFSAWMQLNGVITEGVQILDGEQDEMDSWMDSETARTKQAFMPGVAEKWTPEHFDTIEQVGGGVKPDLVVVTMEIPRPVVQRIIDTAAAANVEVIVYASPGIRLVSEYYARITHLICNDGDAAKTLAYESAEVQVDTYPKMCEQFVNGEELGVPNVVIRMGHLGTCYKNANADGFVSGFKHDSEIVDETGTTAAFVGAYAMDYLVHKRAGTWDIESSTRRGNKVAAISSEKIGYKNAMPWSEEINSFDLPALYDSIDALKMEPEEEVFPLAATNERVGKGITTA